MPRYQAREPIYLSRKGRLVHAGEIFSSDEPPGLAWIALDPPARKPAVRARPQRKR